MRQPVTDTTHSLHLGAMHTLQESTFLVASITVLVLGMVFASKGFQPGTLGYILMNVVAAVVIGGSCGLFLLLLGFEVRWDWPVRHVALAACSGDTVTPCAVGTP